MKWLVWALLACFMAGDAVAQAPLYLDADPAASYLRVPPGGRARFRAMIQASIQKNPRNVSALVHRAYLHSEAGDIGRAIRDYDAALVASDPGSPQQRHVYWSRGWSKYDQGDFEGALADWAEAERLHAGRPSWVPYTYALGYWSKGERGAALQWFGLAVASHPALGTDKGLETRIKHWSAPQQEQMRALYVAWKGAGI